MDENKLSTESLKDYQIRLCKDKDVLGISWLRISELINKESGNNLAPSTYRGWWRSYSEGFSDGTSCKPEDITTEISSKLEQLEIAKIQLQDQVRESRNLLRFKAREKFLISLIENSLKEVSLAKPLPSFTTPLPKSNKTKEGVLLLSDWHYGMETENYFNVFNPKVFEERLAKLLASVIQYGKDQEITDLHVMNLGDMISGSIHVTSRISASEDVVSQTMRVAEFLCEFVNSLTEYFNIHFYSVRGNHDRVSHRAKDYELSKESYAEFIPWYMKARLKGGRVTFHENEKDDEVILTTIQGLNILGVHGHKDSFESVIPNMSLMFKVVPDIVVMGHFHHAREKEVGVSSTVIINPSLCGPDEYSRDIRKASKAAQKFLVLTSDGILCTYNIFL